MFVIEKKYPNNNYIQNGMSDPMVSKLRQQQRMKVTIAPWDLQAL